MSVLVEMARTKLRGAAHRLHTAKSAVDKEKAAKELELRAIEFVAAKLITEAVEE